MKNFLGKMFWASVHLTTVVLLASSYVTLTAKSQPALQTTAVLSSKITPVDPSTIDSSTTMGIVNVYRNEHELSLLTEDATLTAMANQRADDMVANQYFAHQNPEGKIFYELMVEQNTAPDAACENLALSYSSEVGAAFRGWKESTAHNACMLDPRMKYAGYAYRQYGTSYDANGQLRTHYLVVAIHGS